MAQGHGGKVASLRCRTMLRPGNLRGRDGPRSWVGALSSVGGPDSLVPRMTKISSEMGWTTQTPTNALQFCKVRRHRAGHAHCRALTWQGTRHDKQASRQLCTYPCYRTNLRPQQLSAYPPLAWGRMYPSVASLEESQEPKRPRTMAVGRFGPQ